MEHVLYQKIGVTVEQLAKELLSKTKGERILSISEYQQKFGVSRGTVQNAFAYLKENGAVELKSRGHMGTFIEELDFQKLQTVCMQKSMLGIMPLPYSSAYQGLATALYEELSDFNCNLAYARGSEGRIHLVEEGVYQFAICSEFAAQKAADDGRNIRRIFEFGAGSYLSRHVLVLRDDRASKIEDGMKVAYDRGSLDQRTIMDKLIEGKKNIQLIDIRAHQTIAAVQDGRIDAGVWNDDEIIESGYNNLHIIPLDNQFDVEKFSTAVLIIKKENDALEKILLKYIDRKRVREIQKKVKSGEIPANY